MSTFSPNGSCLNLKFQKKWIEDWIWALLDFLGKDEDFLFFPSLLKWVNFDVIFKKTFYEQLCYVMTCGSDDTVSAF